MEAWLCKKNDIWNGFFYCFYLHYCKIGICKNRWKKPLYFSPMLGLILNLSRASRQTRKTYLFRIIWWNLLKTSLYRYLMLAFHSGTSELSYFHVISWFRFICHAMIYNSSEFFQTLKFQSHHDKISADQVFALKIKSVPALNMTLMDCRIYPNVRHVCYIYWVIYLIWHFNIRLCNVLFQCCVWCEVK